MSGVTDVSDASVGSEVDMEVYKYNKSGPASNKSSAAIQEVDDATLPPLFVGPHATFDSFRKYLVTFIGQK
jgi:hypothetical protein